VVSRQPVVDAGGPVNPDRVPVTPAFGPAAAGPQVLLAEGGKLIAEG
jgi:hypothetical protein